MIEWNNQQQDRPVQIKEHQEYEKIVKKSSHEGPIRKRPLRFLPAKFLYGEKKNDTANDHPLISKFYGPPTICSDLSNLGYTLNGFYLVKPLFKNSTK